MYHAINQSIKFFIDLEIHFATSSNFVIPSTLLSCKAEN